ncbi:hypothetical protein VTJ49DRAFT_7021 [Mycothermus thermophilus]|uniref:Bacteriocin-protection protein n=1 Tax=Humicola insolens TaxID=85995 RepID=A0ABR3VJ05_HUMIN
MAERLTTVPIGTSYQEVPADRGQASKPVKSINLTNCTLQDAPLSPKHVNFHAADQNLQHDAAWEEWLENNHSDGPGVWLKMAKKGGGTTSITYDEALDAALCWGWIDGQRKGFDAQHFLQRFTPRRNGSLWSKRNCDKVASLIEAGRMRSPGLAEVEKAKASGLWEKAYAGSSTIEVPNDFQDALDRNPKAKTFFEGLGRTKRYPFLWRITTAKRAETRSKRIEQFVELLAAGKTLS